MRAARGCLRSPLTRRFCTVGRSRRRVGLGNAPILARLWLIFPSTFPAGWPTGWLTRSTRRARSRGRSTLWDRWGVARSRSSTPPVGSVPARWPRSAPGSVVAGARAGVDAPAGRPRRPDRRPRPTRDRGRRRAGGDRPARRERRRRGRPVERVPCPGRGRRRRGRPDPSAGRPRSSSSTTTAATTSRAWSATGPSTADWGRRGGWYLRHGFRLRVVHCFWTFATLDDARGFVEEAFPETGPAVADDLKRPRLSYNVAVYHRTRGEGAGRGSRARTLTGQMRRSNPGLTSQPRRQSRPPPRIAGCTSAPSR